MKKIEKIFEGPNAMQQNALLHIIRKRGYKFFQCTSKNVTHGSSTTMTINLIEDLHKLGYEIVKKG